MNSAIQILPYLLYNLKLVIAVLKMCVCMEDLVTTVIFDYFWCVRPA